MDSVISQFENNVDRNFELEYIIHDGASTDGTFEIINEYSKKYKFIKFSSFEDNGLYDGIVSCLKKVTGNIVAYINSGDLYSTKSFEIVNQILNKEKKIKWITGLKCFYNDNSEIIQITKPYKYRSNLIQAGVYGRYLPFIQQESTFWRAELNQLLDFEYLKKLKLSGDYFLWYSFSKFYDLYTVNSYLSGFKYHQNQLTFKETGKTDVYLKEVNKFKDKIKFKDVIHIILDAPVWYLFKSLGNSIPKNTKNYISFNLLNSQWEIINRKKYFCWLTELNKNQGEGILGSMFLKTLSLSSSQIEVKTPTQHFNYSNEDDLSNNILKDNELNKSFFKKYIYPLIGIIHCWIAFFQKKKIIYVNYVPLWNIIIFLLSPPKTFFGPITGGIFKGEVKNIEHILRKYFLPRLYYISLQILKLRGQKLIFSTENLKEIMSPKEIENSNFNFFLNNFEFDNRNKEREIDIIIYHRIYSTKKSEFLRSLAIKLGEEYKVYIVGDKINHKNITNLGKISREELVKSINRSKHAIISGENFSSLFARDCIEKNVSIFFNKENKVPDIFNFKNDKIIPINFKNIEKSYKIIKENIKNYNINNIYSLKNFSIDNKINLEIFKKDF
tara:strand:+ start:2916 stop:4754 length:1839 start_codon:yes stop_codon:yes gene_type:complete